VTSLRAGRSGFDSRQGLGIFLFDTMSRPALGPNQRPIQWVPGALSPGVEWPGCETDRSPPFGAIPTSYTCFGGDWSTDLWTRLTQYDSQHQNNAPQSGLRYCNKIGALPSVLPSHPFDYCVTARERKGRTNPLKKQQSWPSNREMKSWRGSNPPRAGGV
jgi:hypothetical protein